MNYFRPYSYACRSRPLGLICLAVLLLIPFVSYMVMYGYRARLSDNHDITEPDETPDDFTFEQFSACLSRGVIPYLYSWITHLFYVMASIANVVALFFIIVSNPNMTEFERLAYQILFQVCSVVLLSVTTILGFPFVLYGSICQKFDFPGCFRFMLDFFSRVGFAMFVVIFPKWIMDILLAIAGLLVCCVGIFPAYAITLIAEQHYIAQLYKLYLSRGGEPLQAPELKVSDYESETAHNTNQPEEQAQSDDEPRKPE
jgi:hypothetical protein